MNLSGSESATANEDTLDMQSLYDATFKNLEEGAVIEGVVIALHQDAVVVDIGYKSEGLISRQEFSEAELETLKPGDKIQIYLQEREDNDGNLILSKEKAAKMKIWETLDRASQRGEIVEGKMIAKIKGGMMVDIGVKAFLPGSQIDLHPVRDLDSLIGKSFPMKIIKMNQRRGNIVVSRRVLLEETRDKKRRAALATLEEGQVIDGLVKNITEYGAFVDLGGIDGLLHITDMSWGRVSHPSEVLSVGDRVGVVILKYDRETGRVSLGLKQRSADPWTSVDKKFPVATRLKGKVVSLTDYGAFVELEPGVEGLVHVSEMTWSHEMRHPSKIVSVGEPVDIVVLTVDRDNRKISLGMKQLIPNPWDTVEAKYSIGSRVTGKIKGLTDFGAFVGLEEGIDGLIHISDMSWTKRLTHPSELFRKGQQVEAMVLKVDRDKERLSLGYKQLLADPWEHDIPGKYHVGDMVDCKVIKATDFGVFVELEDGIEGLIHLSETTAESPARLAEMLPVNETARAVIIKVDSQERKIALSVNALQADPNRAKKKK